MFVLHIKNFRRLAVAGGCGIMAVALLFVLVGCLGKGVDPAQQTVSAATNEERLVYLAELGWQVEAEPVETMTSLPSASLPRAVRDVTAEVKRAS